jgi:peptidyl-prolyl cis-trans isomerase C
MASQPLSGPQRIAFLRRWSREPLLHFLFAGALIFAVYELMQPPTGRGAEANQIVLTKDDLRQLAVFWLAQGYPPPTADQMRGLVDQKVREEILSREAVALGLGKDDEIIRRRLAQKMDFLAADVAALQDPNAAELKAWFAQNSGRFALPPLFFVRSRAGSPASSGGRACEARR